MSATPLIESAQYTASQAWHDEFTTNQEIEAIFQDWHVKRRMEWSKKSGKLTRDYLRLWKTDKQWYDVDIDGRGGWNDPVTAYTIGFSGHGAQDLETAAHIIDAHSIALEMAKELQKRLDAGELTPPKLSDDQDKWTDLLTGKEHQRGVA